MMPAVRRSKTNDASSFRGTARWKRTRLIVLRRDGYICHWCGGYGNEADHVQPVSQGGAKWDLGNLVAACGPCNRARPVQGEGVSAYPTHRYARRGVRFSEGGASIYAPRRVLSPRNDDTPHMQRPPVRISQRHGGSRAKSAGVVSDHLDEVAGAEGAYPPTEMHSVSSEERVIVRDYTRKAEERGGS